VLCWSLADEDGHPLGTLDVTWPGAAPGSPFPVEALPEAVIRSLVAERDGARVLPLRRAAKR
jgi:hypothetical protein